MLSLLTSWSDMAFGQIMVNEFVASNSSVIEDPDFHNSSDWLELYNTGNTAVNLRGFYVTDNLNNPTKWKVPVDTLIAPGGFVVIWTDGRDTGMHTSYKLSQLGEEIGIYTPAGLLSDSIHYVIQSTDISQGRFPDGSSQWFYFDQPTPGTGNNTPHYENIVYSTPAFSVNGGLYNSPLNVGLTSYMGGIIRYTLDGSEPRDSDPVYSNPISVDKTTVVRARIFRANSIPGPTVTHSYFLNEPFQSGNLPVVSIATDPGNFWDPAYGIYVQDFKPEWEIPVNIELFENNGSDRAAFSQRAGLKINGLHSWQLPQKMLGIYFRKRYESGNLDYPLIFNKSRKSYKTFALRASGSDWSYTLFRDGMAQNAIALNMDVDRIGFRACVVYVDGQYMGIHNIREKVDEDFILKNHDLEEGTVDMVENEDYAEAGVLDEYNEFAHLYSQNLSVQSNYDKVASAMDIENFTDLICTEVYSRNSSINHNVMAWKPKGSGKWKWILTDLDRGFFNPSTDLINYYTSQSVWPFRALMNNPGYVDYFGKRLADHLYTTFNPIRIKKLIDLHQQTIASEMPDHIERWLGTTSSYGDAIPSLNYWYGEVDALRTFADARPVVLLQNLTSYGFDGYAMLNLSTSPSDAGTFTFNNMKIPEPEWSGYYLQNVQIELTADEKPGYQFKGWSNSSGTRTIAIAKNSAWKYNDKGLNLDTAWRETNYDDASWAEGLAELGYGDGDENTVVDYGGNANNKFITTYFRRSFELTKEQRIGNSYFISLLCDDGAVVYVNGKEALRVNMAYGPTDYLSHAISAIGSPLESQFVSYGIDADLLKTGTNIIAVEVHQSGGTSSDVSFNLELYYIKQDVSNILSTDKTYQFSLTGDLSLTAVYESEGKCIIPDVISEDMILTSDCSPWLTQGNITVLPGVSLTIEAGVEIQLPPGANIFVNGRINATGNAGERIIFKLNPGYGDKSWGAICFINSSDTSHFSYVTIEDASRGPDPSREVAAISAFKSNLILDNVILDDVDDNPIAGRYSDITLTNSSLHSKVTGDLINIKYGKGRIENCTFRGNDKPDTDGIDYDDVEDGIIRNSIVYDLRGFNSDGIDIGEQAHNITIDSMLIFDITDKGISVGQKSTVNISNSAFVNCNLGLGLKDSCRVTVDHCTFYSNNIPVSCFEKNAGDAGGNAWISNSILSNSYERSYFADKLSSIFISYCLSDNDTLPDNAGNKFGNPLFVKPNTFNFQLLAGSPGLNASNNGTEYPDLGTRYNKFSKDPYVMFSAIFYNPLNVPGESEYLVIINPSEKTVDLSGYKLTNGVIFDFPHGTTLNPGEKYVLVKDLYSTPWQDYGGKIMQWTEGSLSNQGEKIELTDSFGIKVDQVWYKPQPPWPAASYTLGEVLVLKSTELDNHFPDSWTTAFYTGTEKDRITLPDESLTVYPNPTSGKIYIRIKGQFNNNLNIYDMAGRQIMKIPVEKLADFDIDLGDFENGTYILQYGDLVQKVVLLK